MSYKPKSLDTHIQMISRTGHSSIYMHTGTHTFTQEMNVKLYSNNQNPKVLLTLSMNNNNMKSKYITQVTSLLDLKKNHIHIVDIQDG